MRTEWQNAEQLCHAMTELREILCASATQENQPMTESRFFLYAIWSDAPERDLLRGLQTIHAQQADLYDLLPERAFRFGDVHLRIGDGFVLFLAEQHWSPGDIGGFLKGQRFFPARASVLAVVVDMATYYLAPHGLSGGCAKQLSALTDFYRAYRLVRRET